jgi:hypothetical protein
MTQLEWHSFVNESIHIAMLPTISSMNSCFECKFHIFLIGTTEEVADETVLSLKTENKI